MSSFRSYGDSGVYRTKLSGNTASGYGRNSSAGSTYSNYRHSYAGIGSLKYSTCTKSAEKERLTPSRQTKDEPRPRSISRCSSSNGSSTSLYDKYGSTKSGERPASVLEKYRGAPSPDSSVSSRCESTTFSESSRGYVSCDKKESGLSHRGLRPKSLQEPIGTDRSSLRIKTPTFGKSGSSTSTSDSSTASKFSNSTTSGRYSLSSRNNPERVTASIGYVASEKLQNPANVKLTPSSLPEDIPKVLQNQNNVASENGNTEKQLNGSSSNGTNESKVEKEKSNGDISSSESKSEEIIVISVVTRGTSPTPPPSLTAFTRTRKLDPIPKPVKREYKKSYLLSLKKRNQAQQVERSENLSRDRITPRYSSGSGGTNTNTRASRVPWVSYYLDKLNSNQNTNPSSYTPRTGYSSLSNSKASETSKLSSSSSTHASDHRSNSSCSNSSSASKDASSRSNDNLAKVDPHLKRNTSEERRRSESRGESSRIVEGQDHVQGPSSRRESLSKSSDTSSPSSRSSKPSSVSRSGSLKSRHTTSADTSLSVSAPTGCNSNRSVGSGSSNSSSSSKSGSAAASSAASTAPATKIKSAGATTTTTTTTSSSSNTTATSASSSSSGSKSPNVSAGSSVCSRQASSPDARDRKPPVPKSEMVGKGGATMVVSPTGSTTSIKYVNKDFRKSALNMENGDPSRSQICERKTKKPQRSISVSSQDSQSEANSESGQTSQQVTSISSGSSNSHTKSSKSGKKSASTHKSPDQSNFKSDKKKDFLETPSIASSNGHVSRLVSRSTTDCSSSESSDEEDQEKQTKLGNRVRRLSGSPFQDGKGRMSAASSRTSVLASSADELSISADKPPRPPSSPRSRSDTSPGKTDDAKSFLMKALAPVANLFKSDNNVNIKNGGWADDAGSEDNSESTNRSRNSAYKSMDHQRSLSKSPSFSNAECKRQARLRHQSSSEKPWWLDPNSDNVPEGVDRNPSVGNDDISQDTTISTVLPDDGKFKFKVWRQDSGERAWWLDDNENNIPDDELNSKELVAPSSPVPEQTSSNLSRKSNTSRSFRSTSSKKAHRLRHQQSGERAWWMSDDPTNVPEGIEVIPVAATTTVTATVMTTTSSSSSSSDGNPLKLLRHVDSGEKAWWMDSSSNVPEGIQRLSADPSNTSDSSESFERSVEIVSQSRTACGFARFPVEDQPLGDRASPEGKENPPDPPDSYNSGRSSPYDNVTSIRQTPPRRSAPRKRPVDLPLFIGTSTNIDDLIGDIIGPGHSPLMPRRQRSRYSEDENDDDEEDKDEECQEIDATQVIIHDSTPQTPVIQRRHRDDSTRPLQPDGYIPLDDTALQLYKDGDYGAYLDLEASISEQQEEFEGFETNRKNSIVLRTQLSVRVHTIIEKLLNSEGRDLRRSLFSLKQIFQEDKDLVHEFVQNDGLACLIKVGSEADQNYQNYILRALGQVMLYVDGMNGVMEHGQTVQWLYTLIASKFRLVVKTALKLLLVFVEYIETNSLLLVRAIRSVDTSRGMIPWTNVMKLLKDYDAADTELLIYATTLVNKCLNGIPDQDTYYDQVDCLEEQGIETIVKMYMAKPGTDLDLLRQFQIYEAVLQHEDGNNPDPPIRQLDDNIMKTLRNRKSLVDSHERRKSRRHSTGTSPLSIALNARLSPRLHIGNGLTNGNGLVVTHIDDDDESSSSQGSQGIGEVQMNGSYKDNKDVGVTPALRRRRERAERQRSFIREQQEATANMRANVGHPDDETGPFNGIRYTNGTSHTNGVNNDSNKLSTRITNGRKDLTPLMNAANKLDSEEKKQQQPWYGKSPDEGVEVDEGNHTDEDEDRRVVLQLKRENTVKDLTQKLTAQNLIPTSPVSEEKVSRIGDVSGLISKAKEGLAKSKSKADVLKSPTTDALPKLAEVKKSENELHWEELVNKLKRPLCLCDLDFTDLNSDDEIDVLGPVNISNGVPPPPPPMAPPPPGANSIVRAPPPPPPGMKAPPPLPSIPPPLFGVNLKSTPPHMRSSPTDNNSTPKSPVPPPQQLLNNTHTLSSKKSKKTVKLFWKEVRDDPIILSRLDKNKMIWDELSPIPVDTQKLEHLFESRAKDLITKKQQEMNKNKEIIVLDHKRSNAINIGMTKLPPPRSIKTAILKMDATIMNREGIEKLLTMLPTEEERSRIQEAQAANPDLPLGSAEQFLLTLASISELPARLKLWAFKLDFENSEKEIADPLMDLKQGMETLRANKTFRGILSTLLSIGIFLNGNEVKGFQLEYLAKVPEVKDTVHKHSLLHHLCHMVMEKFPDSTDLYSEIGAVTRASKIDFDELASNIGKLESECKASWDHLKLIAKHDGSTMMKVKMSDFLSDCAERIIVLSIVHRRIVNRFHKFILWLGIPLHRVQDTKPNEFCRIVSEFALEYRTTRERVLQQLEKKANHRERNKTRGKMITEVGKFRTKEDRQDAELRQLLGSDISDVESIHGTLPWRRQRKDGRTPLGPLLRDEHTNGNLTDGDDELLESLVKTATKTPATRTTPRERKRTRHADRKSLRRTLKNGLSEEEKKHIAAYIKGY